MDACPNGIQVEGSKKISKVATAVSADLATIEKAVSEGVNALIVHHGLFWFRDSDEGRILGTKRKKIQLLMENQISLLAYHLPLDAHVEVGNNWKAAKELGWQNLSSFGFYNKKWIGVKGTFPLQPIESFVKQLETYYGHHAVGAWGGKREVSSAALISGGAYREVVGAAKEGLDCFVTGNFDEPAWAWSHEEKIHFLAMGHSATEKVGPRALSEKIAQQFGISSSFLDIPNPF